MTDPTIDVVALGHPLVDVLTHDCLLARQPIVLPKSFMT